MSFDTSLFYSSVPEKLQGSHKLLEAHIASYAELASTEADLLQKYREKRSMLLKKAYGEGVPATISGDIVRGECAQEKADWMKALAAKQQCKYNISAVQDRIYTIRHLSAQIEHQLKGG
jgi:hypothetical protein